MAQNISLYNIYMYNTCNSSVTCISGISLLSSKGLGTKIPTNFHVTYVLIMYLLTEHSVMINTQRNGSYNI